MLLGRDDPVVPQVANMAMIPANEARIKLYQMLQAGFVELQEVPRAPDRAAARTYFLWRVDIDATLRMMFDATWASVANVRYARARFCAHTTRDRACPPPAPRPRRQTHARARPPRQL